MSRITIIGLSIALVLTAAVGLLGGRAIAAELATPSTVQQKQVVVDQASQHLDAPVPSDSFTTVELEPVSDDSSARMGALKFVDRFSQAHDEADVDYLLATLHPAVSDTFGSAACEQYTHSTMGSITDMVISHTGEPTTFTLPGPDGELVFDNAIPVEAYWTVVATGDEVPVLFHIVPAEGTLRWLTTCGWQQPA